MELADCTITSFILPFKRILWVTLLYFSYRHYFCIAQLFQEKCFPQGACLMWVEYFCRLWRTSVFLVNDEVHFEAWLLWFAGAHVWSALLGNWLLLCQQFYHGFYVFCFCAGVLFVRGTQLLSGSARGCNPRHQGSRRWKAEGRARR